jgi:protein TonB
MTDQDDDDFTDDPSVYPAAGPRRGISWLIAVLLFAIAIAIGLVVSSLWIHNNPAPQATVAAADTAAPLGPTHKPLPSPTGGETTTMPTPTSAAADAAATVSSPVASNDADAASPPPSTDIQASPENAATDTQPAPTQAPGSTPAQASPAATDESFPQVVVRTPPVYPTDAVNDHLEGEVRLQINVDAQGSVGEIRIVKSSGSGSLDRAAVDAAMTWHYKAALRDGQPVAGTIEVPVDFRLGAQQ